MDFDIKLKYGECYPGYFLLIKAMAITLFFYFIFGYAIPTYLVFSGKNDGFKQF